MPAVTENRLKGNYGTSLVMSRLSGECLVRPVAADTDVGVDLYCETVAESGPAHRRPFLHFWLQVKTGEQCKVDSHGKTASCSLKLDHLDYYREQPVPVFAALVPTTKWPVRTEPDVYIVDITTQILAGDFPTEQESVILWSARYNSSASDLQRGHRTLAHALAAVHALVPGRASAQIQGRYPQSVAEDGSFLASLLVRKH